MFVGINLKDRTDFEVSWNFSQESKRAFRPAYFKGDTYQCYLLGSLVGYYSEGKLKKATLNEVMQQYERQPTQDFVESLEGLYLLYIYDQKSQTHLIINNRYQLTKLYYRVVNNEKLEVSNQLSELTERADHVEPHFSAVYNFLSNGFNTSDQCQIQGIKKLLPCFWLSVDENGVSLQNFWDRQLTFEREPFSDLKTHLDKYESLYQKTLSNYLDQRDPAELGTLLSGGHDTSFVMAQASQVYNKPIHAFTTVFPGWAFDEGQYAENICTKFKGVFHPVEFSTSHLDLLLDLVRATEEPVLGSSLPLHQLAKEASLVTDTMLGGDGGDTLWGEYYPVGEYHRWVKNFPLLIRRWLHSLSKGLRATTDWERFWELEHVAGLFAEPDFYNHFMSKLCTYRHFTPKYLSELLVPEVFNAGPIESSLEVPFTKENFDDSLIEGKLYNAFYTYQSFQQTRSMNSVGMEFYLPTVNYEMIRFITSLPKEWVNGGNTFHRLTNNKRINRRFHKRALSRYMNKKEIYNRSFDIPWFQIIKPRRHLLDLLRVRLKKRGWFQEQAVDNLLRQFSQEKNKDYELLELKSHGYRVLALLSLEVWASQFLDRQKLEPGMSIEDFLR